MTVQLKETPTSRVEQASPVAPSPREEPRFCFGLSRLWELRQLISIMVRRDFFGRYRGSLLGMLWPVINPLGHLALYTFVFCIILKVRFGTDASTSNFALYLMTGMLPWGALAESLARSTTCILEVPNLVKRVVFPLEILPFVLVMSALLTEFLAMSVLIPLACLYQQMLPWTLVFLPLIALSKMIMLCGMTWILASLGVFVRDVRHMISLLLSVWMYLTPIVYPQSAVPANLQFIVWLNPMAGLINDYRRVILEGLPPDWTAYCLYTTFAVAVWWLGFNFFFRTKRSFADVM